MGNLFAERMSSSDKREIQRKLERASMPPNISTSFPAVNSEGYLHTRTSPLSSSPSKAPISSPRRRKTRKVDRVFDGTELTEETSRKPRRRASIEEQIRQDAYHTILEGGQPFRDDEAVDDVNTDLQGTVQSEPPKEESSNIRQLQLASPIPDAPVETSRPSMVSVLCGRQDPESWYLTRRLVRMPGNDEDDLVPLLKQRNIDPDAAELHRLWRRTGVIPTRYRDINFDPEGIDPQHTWVACWPLINAAIHGHMLEDGEFVDRVMDLLDKKIVKGVRPDIDTISHIFGEKRQHVPIALQRFLVDRWIDLSTRGFGDVDPHSLPELFICVALDTATRRLSHLTQHPSLSGCQYHTHSKTEGCHRNRNIPAEAMRQERYKYRREKASREVEQATADLIEHNVATIDWEVRRAKAHRALHDQVDEYWLASGSRMEATGYKLEADHSKKLAQIGDAGAIDRGVDSEIYLNTGSSSSSVFKTAQAEGAVDEVKFAPPARELSEGFSALQGIADSRED